MERRFSIAAGGADLAAERWIADGARVVLLHAGVCDRRSWQGVAGALAADGLDVVAYDRRGFGETPGAAGEFRHLDDLLAVLDAVGGGEPVWLVGSSRGGEIALDAALTAPERVAGLVLIAPAVSGAPDPAELDPATERFSDAIDAAEERDDLDALNRLEAALWLDGPAGPEGRAGEAARELVLDMNGIALHSGVPEDAGESGVDAWSRLGEIHAPVTLAWGDRDLPFIADRCAQLAERLPAVAGTHVFAGTAHLPYLERPDEVAAVVRAAVG
jgi:pimeloyl-ACP methyl ester carboxylesterase